MNNKTKQFIAWIKRAKALVRKGWTQTFCARNANGCQVSATSPFAVCWCPVGAMIATQPVGLNFSSPGLAEWNDAPGRTQAEVIAMFDNSIRALGGEP